ncbi:MAG: ABC transporter ATP-binding protein [Candidatus Helarchaeota archaeon]
MKPIVDLRDVTKIYTIGDVKIFALRRITMRVQRGEVLGIIGPSGSGKTTLLNLIGTLDKPDSGEIFINGTNINLISKADLIKIRRKMIGYIFQFYNLIPVLNALDNVALPMLLEGLSKESREKRAKELLEMVGLKKRFFHKPDELSGGEQQRVAIARALANDPALVLADEPTGDLDEETGIEIITEMKRIIINENKTLIIVTHDPIISKLSSRILQLRDGQILSP